jgi:hypothetical protein
MDDVIDFPKGRAKVFSEEDALAYLRREGCIETTVTALAKAWGWERTKTSKALSRWTAEGKITREPGTNNQTVFSAVVAGVQADVAQAAHPVPHTDAQAAQPVEADIVQPTEVGVAQAAPPVLHADPQPTQPNAQPIRRALGLILAAITPASISAVTLFLVALALGGTGLVMNARYAASLGSSDEGAIVLAVVGVGVDILAMIFPSVALALWHRGHRSLAMLPWTMWPVMVVLSLMAAAGFASSNLADVFAQRSRAAFTAAGIEDTVRRLRTERAGIAEKRSVAELEIQLQRDRPKVDRIDRDAWNDTKGCTRLTTDGVRACAPILPTLQALSVAQHRDAVDEQLRVAEASLASASTVVAVDPQAETVAEIVAWITAGLMKPSPADIARLRVLGLVAIPSLAGLVLSLAFALAAPRAVSNSLETIGSDAAIN